MKPIRVLLVLLLASISHSILAQDAHSKYVTIGVFRIRDNAERFTNQATKSGRHQW